MGKDDVKTLSKVQLVEDLQSRIGGVKKDSVHYVESFFSALKESFLTEDVVKLSGFGSFHVKLKKDRKGRNPQTGETISIKGRRVATFKVSTLLVDKIKNKRGTD